MLWYLRGIDGLGTERSVRLQPSKGLFLLEQYGMGNLSKISKVEELKGWKDEVEDERAGGSCGHLHEFGKSSGAGRRLPHWDWPSDPVRASPRTTCQISASLLP